MTTATTPVDVEPEGLYEIVDGRFVEKQLGYPEALIATELMRALILFDPQRQHGWVLLEMLFELESGKRLARRPDLAFVSYDRWPRHQAVEPGLACPVVPDLVVEVISPWDTGSEIQKKLREYFRACVRIVWQIFPGETDADHTALVYEVSGKVYRFSVDNDLEGGDVIPGFRIKFGSLFPPIGPVEG